MAARMPVAVLGAGSWGTALAALACGNADTLLWARDEAQAQRIHTHHDNPRYLPDVALPPALRCTSSFGQAVAHATSRSEPGLIILGVPVAGLAQVCGQLAHELPPDSRISVIWTCKGFEPSNALLPHEVAQAALAARPDLGLGVLSGPSFAREIAQGLPAALTIASAHARVADTVTRALHGNTVRIYASTDVTGVEVGGALKNVMAIACGISDGLGLGANARAALITRGLAEMQRLGVALGGLPATFMGLTGVGDLVLTATGDLSRNRRVGLAIGQGRAIADVLSDGTTAEGVRCARAALELGRRHGLELPITDAVCRVLFEHLPPSQAVAELLGREARAES